MKNTTCPTRVLKYPVHINIFLNKYLTRFMVFVPFLFNCFSSVESEQMFVINNSFCPEKQRLYSITRTDNKPAQLNTNNTRLHRSYDCSRFAASCSQTDQTPNYNHFGFDYQALTLF